MPIDLQPLLDQVTTTEGVEDSAIALINGFAAAVEAANTTHNTAISEVVARFKTKSDALAAAVAANPGA